jgi:hypothetical protein
VLAVVFAFVFVLAVGVTTGATSGLALVLPVLVMLVLRGGLLLLPWLLLL